MRATADLPRFPFGQMDRGVPFIMMHGHLRVFLDTALFASAIEPTLSDTELRDYEEHTDECRIIGSVIGPVS